MYIDFDQAEAGLLTLDVKKAIQCVHHSMATPRPTRSPTPTRDTIANMAAQHKKVPDDNMSVSSTGSSTQAAWEHAFHAPMVRPATSRSPRTKKRV